MIGPAQVELAITTFVTFFVVIDAVAVAPIFASLTVGKGGGYARAMAVKSAVVAAVLQRTKAQAAADRCVSSEDLQR